MKKVISAEGKPVKIKPQIRFDLDGTNICDCYPNELKIQRPYEKQTMKYRITSVDYDTDGQEIDLPQIFIFEADNPDELADMISDETGWCVNSLTYEVIE